MSDERTDRNLKPHREALLAMIVFGDNYAQQNGGSMDFWDDLTPFAQQSVRDWLDVLDATPREPRS